MSSEVRRVHSAVKHGAYSATAVLPGESLTEFEELHRELITELCPSGAIEDDAVANIARLLWRKKNLRTLSTAELAQERYSEILTENVDADFSIENSAKCEEQMRFANDLAQKELGGIYELVEAGEASTFDGLSKELDIQERLDAAISRCLKRLLLVRGIKSISETSLPTSGQKRIADPSKAA
jgi:predicted transcriptional regulator